MGSAVNNVYTLYAHAPVVAALQDSSASGKNGRVCMTITTIGESNYLRHILSLAILGHFAILSSISSHLDLSRSNEINRFSVPGM